MSEMDYKKIGQRIETRRKQLDMTLTDLAAGVDLSASTIQRYEKGKFDRIKLPVIEAIASALHVNPTWLIGKTDDPIDYDDGDLLATIPLSYMEACDGNAEQAFKMMQAVDSENIDRPIAFAQNDEEEEMLLLARHMEPIPEEDRKELTEQFKKSINMYLKAMGLSGMEDK